MPLFLGFALGRHWFLGCSILFLIIVPLAIEFHELNELGILLKEFAVLDIAATDLHILLLSFFVLKLHGLKDLRLLES